MKKNMNRIIALGLAMGMLSTTAYAEEVAETVDTAAQEEAEEVIEDDVLTLDEAIELLLDNSISLSQIEIYEDYLQVQKERVWDSYGSFAVPTADYQQWADVSVYSYKSSIYDITSSAESSKLNEATLELTAELTLLNAFSTLFSTYESIESMEAMIATSETSYAQSELKHSLGMISDYTLDQAKVSLDSMYSSVAQLDLSIESQFITLNNLLGFSTDERYNIENPFEYEVYTIDNMDTFVTFALKSDMSIAQYELAVDSAEFDKNFLSVATTTTQTDANSYNYDKAKLDLKNAKTTKEESIRSAYIQLQQMELSYNEAVIDLAQAEKDYALAETNFAVGNITQLALDQAALTVVQAENEIASLERSYALQVFRLENTTIL
ncbi:TolC family protein [Chakrabartyella piscis]|uniref:TolC family protein n=1 Tax=Chakrabartyella piscis TaxID=2918914 RepID=UPI002958BB50|nr:TolC family protein [Chakrabartyella piscis]